MTQPLPAPWQRAATGANLLASDGALGVTIFEEMTTLAMQTGAINLGQGFPDEDGPAEIKAAAQAAIAEGSNQYAPGKGIPNSGRQCPHTRTGSTGWNRTRTPKSSSLPAPLRPSRRPCWLRWPGR